MKTISDLDAFTFALRVMADRSPKACDVAYLFGEHEDVEVSVLNAGHNIYFDGFASKIAITALGPYCGYTGFEQWRAALHKVGVGDNTIVAIPRTPHEISNTFTEAEELLSGTRSRLDGKELFALRRHSIYRGRSLVSLPCFTTTIRNSRCMRVAVRHCHGAA